MYHPAPWRQAAGGRLAAATARHAHAMSTVQPTPTAQTPAPAAHTRGTLSLLKVADLKRMADAANTPTTGTKTALIERILNPADHRRKRAKNGTGIQKKKQGVKKPPASKSKLRAGFLGHGGYGGYSACGGYGSFGSDCSDDDDDMDECERCGERSYIDPHNGLCGDCAEAIRPAGGCPCWRQTCEYFEDCECFECEA